MFNNKIVKMKKESFVESESIAYYIEDTLKRKLAFANTCTLFAFRNYVEKNNFKQEPMTKLNLFRIPAIAEKYGISDIYLDNIRLDVRVSLDGKVFPIPKVHISNALAADFYVVFKGTKNPLKCEALGYISKEDLIFDSQDDEYYYISTAILNPIDEIKETLNNFQPEEKKFFETEHKLAIENFGAFLDGDLDEIKSNDLIKHLVNCPDCRAYCVNYSFLEDALTGIKYYPDLIDLVKEPEEEPQQDEISFADTIENDIVEENEQQVFELDTPMDVLADGEVIENFADGLDTDFVDLSNTELSFGEDDLNLSGTDEQNDLVINDDFVDLNNTESMLPEDNTDLTNNDNQEVLINDNNVEELSISDAENMLDIDTVNEPIQASEDDSYIDLNFDNNEEPTPNETNIIETDIADTDFGIDTNNEPIENFDIPNDNDDFGGIEVDIPEDTTEIENTTVDTTDNFTDTDNDTNIDDSYAISDMQMESSIFDTEESNNNTEQFTLNDDSDNNDNNDFLLDIGEEIPINDNVEINYTDSNDNNTSSNIAAEDDMGLGIPLINDDNIDEVIAAPDINLHELYTNNLGESKAEEPKTENNGSIILDDISNTNVVSDDINTVYDKDISTPEIENIEIETTKKTPKKASNKTLIIIILAVALVLSGGLIILNFSNNGNNPNSNAGGGYSGGMKTDGGSQDINKAMTNAFSDAQGAIKVSKISWQVEQDLASNPDASEYLKTLGETLGDNIDAAIPYVVVSNPPTLTKVLIKVNKSGDVDKIIFAESSGSEEMDNTIEQAIRKSMQSLPLTSYVTTKKDTNLILVVNF